MAFFSLKLWLQQQRDAARGQQRRRPPPLRQRLQVEILEDRITPSFSPGPGSPFAVGTGPVAVAIGDLNRDGIPDMVVANQGSNNVSVRLGTGGGDFRRRYQLYRRHPSGQRGDCRRQRRRQARHRRRQCG